MGNENESNNKQHLEPPKPKADAFRVDLNPHSSVKKLIAVVSGKGGVGKSSVTGLCALHTHRLGYKTAILDADITGPSMPKMFNLTPADVSVNEEQELVPAQTPGGLKMMSMNLLMEEETTPVVWRSPVITGAVKQFWTDVCWGDVDYMFIDMPPGTGDVPLTVFQSLPIDGIIIVTTPQDLVSMIVKKAIAMAQMMNIKVLGLVENMSYVACPHCGEEIALFGESHIEEVAKSFCKEGETIPVIARLPVNPELTAAFDNGKAEDYEFLRPDGSDLLEGLDAVLPIVP